MRLTCVTLTLLALLGSACGDDDDDPMRPADAGVVMLDAGPDIGVVQFLHGVASGDPLSDRVVIWTRATPDDASVTELEVTWVVATDEAFANVVQQGIVRTSTASDLSVKVDVTGLSAATTYYYRFLANGLTSPTGRTKTLPVGPVGNVRFAVVSCSHYSAGYFNAYRAIAERRLPSNDLDAVIHLGDYFYEYGVGEYGDNNIAGRAPIPPTEVFTLEDYRARHAQYKTDPDLQAMHATHPMIAVWDDHESANNAWTDGAENHQPVSEGQWGVREAAAIQAYYEWMPIRTPAMGGSIFRRFEFGSLATLHMIDTRLEGRQQQLDYASLATGTQAFVQQFVDPQRTLLGMAQEQWLTTGLMQSTATWQVVGNQVMLGQLYTPSVPNPTNDPVIAQSNMIAQAGEQLAAMNVIPGPSLPFSLDAWDGYIAARGRLFQALSQVSNPLVITGDFHNSWAVELTPDANLRQGGGYNPMTGEGSVGVEFVVTSVTSPGFEGTLADPLLDPILALIQLRNPHIRYADLRRRGFLVVTLTPNEATGQFIFSPSVSVASGAEVAGPTFVVQAGQKRIRR